MLFVQQSLYTLKYNYLNSFTWSILNIIISISIRSNYDNIIKCLQPSCNTRSCTSLCTFPCTLWCTQCSNQKSSIFSSYWTSSLPAKHRKTGQSMILSMMYTLIQYYYSSCMLNYPKSNIRTSFNLVQFIM